MLSLISFLNDNKNQQILKVIQVGARSSPLSLAQIEEILTDLQVYHPLIRFTTLLYETTGDRDQKTSLRELDKTDFFTKEIDESLLSQQCRIAIHSAKDLPEPLPKGLKIVALTEGVDPSDSLVLREGEKLENLPEGAIIATSSQRREHAVKQLRRDLQFIDLRGTIGQRLAKLQRGEADGIVVAEAALIRLRLTHLNRVRLPGKTAPNQGKIAILAREDDWEMSELFVCLDSRIFERTSACKNPE